MALHVALVGATGNLGGPVLQALLNAGFKVTALSRSSTAATKLPVHPQLTVRQVDLSSTEALTPVLRGVDAVVATVATVAMGLQKPLIDAAVAAGTVQRYIPSEFGMDSRNEHCLKLPVVCAPKGEMQAYLEQKRASHPQFSWTAVATGLFLDWGIEEGLIIDPRHHKATYYDGGDVPFTTTRLADIGLAVAGVLQHLEETKNRVVYVQSASVTQRQLVQYAQEVDKNTPWETTVVETEPLRIESEKQLQAGVQGQELEKVLLDLSCCGIFHEGYGGDFSGHLDNELLGVPGMSKEAVKALVQDIVRKIV